MAGRFDSLRIQLVEMLESCMEQGYDCLSYPIIWQISFRLGRAPGP